VEDRGSWVEDRAVSAGVEELDVSTDERALRAFCSRASMWTAGDDILDVVFGRCVCLIRRDVML
jgi:hypothetical protein